MIINADSQQVYRDVRILSARPSPEDEARIPHRLYGFLDGETACSAGLWLAHAKAAIDEARSQGKRPIVCGGTGLYLKTLMEGIADIPDVPQHYREEATALYAEIGGEAFRERLRAYDLELAEKLHAGDRQRLIRAFEVCAATGTPLSVWQQRPTVPPFPEARFEVETITPERDTLYARCDARFLDMLEHGAVEEVARLKPETQNLNPPPLVFKIIGVAELARYIAGEWSLEEATARAQQATRNYAKRQLTWFRHQMKT